MIISYHFHSPPPLGGRHSSITIPFGMEKTRMVWLPDGEKNFHDMFSRFDRIPACDRRSVTDGQTDGQTSFHSIVRAIHARRAVKCVIFPHSVVKMSMAYTVSNDAG